jgi:hypothetical protein
MAAKKSAVEKLTGAVQDAASAVVKVLGLTDEPKEAGGGEVAPKATPAAAAPEATSGDKRTTGKQTIVTRMMTKPVAGLRKTTATRAMSGPVGDAGQPPKGRGDTGAKGPRRGASKGR